MRAFYGDRFSPNMTRTPEGFLICHNVPIARTGTQDYLPQELGLPGHDVVHVHRYADDVFSPAAIASFEGKPVTDDHPKTDVDATNYSTYMRGVVQNVRRSNDYIMADLVIHDANLIAEIEAGKREVSCGYDCKYVQDGDDTYKQVDIVGNHVAVVYRGRAGHAVSIKDEKPKRGDKNMKNKESILQKMFASFVKDADPEDIQEAAKAVSSAEGQETAPLEDEDPVEKKPECANDVDVKELAETVDSLAKTVDSLATIILMQRPAGTSTLDELEEELTAKEEQKPEETEDEEEKSVTIDPEDISEDEETEEGLPQPQNAADKAIALAAIRAIKPVVAALPAAQRKKAVDALNKAVRDAMQKEQAAKKDTTYAKLTKRKANDAKLNERVQFGENCRKRNPHYKGGN